MGAVKEPRHPLEKRELLHKEPPDARRIDAIAAHLLESGRCGEAVEYIEVTRTPSLVSALEAKALEASSPFLLQQAERLGSGPHDESVWIAMAERCLTDGRPVEAVRALTIAGLEERAEEVRLEHCPEYEPFRPLGK